MAALSAECARSGRARRCSRPSGTARWSASTATTGRRCGRSSGGRQGSIDVNRSLMPYVDVLFGHEGDIAATHGRGLARAALARRSQLRGRWPRASRRSSRNIKVIATTTRRPKTANRNDWAAFGWAEGKVFRSMDYLDLEIFDRVGGGDSFASGLIYGLLERQGNAVGARLRRRARRARHDHRRAIARWPRWPRWKG